MIYFVWHRKPGYLSLVKIQLNTKDAIRSSHNIINHCHSVSYEVTARVFSDNHSSVKMYDV